MLSDNGPKSICPKAIPAKIEVIINCRLLGFVSPNSSLIIAKAGRIVSTEKASNEVMSAINKINSILPTFFLFFIYFFGLC